MKRTETERRLRKMAAAKVEMLLGIYIWPDGRSAVDPKTGLAYVSNRELLRIGGYSSNYRSPATTLFADPYFLGQIKTEMARREERHNKIVPFDPSRVATIRDLAFDELESRLRNDSVSFTRAEIINVATKFEELARHLGANEAPKHDNSKMNQFNAFISRTVNVMNEKERVEFVGTATDAAGARLEQLTKLIDQANAVEEDADDLDVIDAEVCSDPD
jgi:hypothetical protein